MPQNDEQTNQSQPDQGGQGAAAVATKTPPKEAPQKKPPQLLPPWKVLLHNDDHNDIEYVIVTVMALAALNQEDAVQRTIEAHETGVALLLTTHKERAELYRDQFGSKGLTVTIEPAE
jgi:ATP-dependent Clp protease adaptor protein ClpS